MKDVYVLLFFISIFNFVEIILDACSVGRTLVR